MGLTEADATMTQDCIDPVGRLSIALPRSRVRRPYRAMVNARLASILGVDVSTRICDELDYYDQLPSALDNTQFGLPRFNRTEGQISAGQWVRITSAIKNPFVTPSPE